MLAGFLDELEKISSSHGRMRVPKERKGRRPMTVTTLLRKEKDGTLFKDAYVADVRASGADDQGAAPAKRQPGDVPSKGSNVDMDQKTGMLRDLRPGEQKKKVTRDDLERVDRMDGRGEAATISGPGTMSGQTSDIASGNSNHY
jgi:hypothetical protein